MDQQPVKDEQGRRQGCMLDDRPALADAPWLRCSEYATLSSPHTDGYKGTATQAQNRWRVWQPRASTIARRWDLPRSKVEPDDPKLVRAVQAGEQAAISRVLHLCLPLLRNVVRARFGLSREESEDVLQEVRIAFIGAAVRFRGECSLRTYLTQIACRKCADHLRGRRHEPESQGDEHSHAAADEDPALDRTVDRLAVSQAMRQLSARERLLLELYYVQGKSYKEISAEMGIAVGTVGGMKAAALMKLRRALGGDTGHAHGLAESGDQGTCSRAGYQKRQGREVNNEPTVS